MTSRRAWGLTWLLLAAVAPASGIAAPPVTAASDGRIPAAPRRATSLPIVAEHQYRMAGKIRPLLLFWISRDDVGGARATWRRGPDGAVGYELLIGSDPARAPRGLNRWGYIAEEVRGPDARLLGVMKESNEQSLDEAKARLDKEAQEQRYVFKAIRAEAGAGEARSEITTIRLARDLTFRDLETLLELVERESAGGGERSVKVAEDTRPGFLVALAELVHRNVAQLGSPTRESAPGRAMSVPYIYNGTLCDLTLRESRLLSQTRAGTRTYRNVMRARFEARNRETRKTTEFELFYGTSGPLAEIPVRAFFQPRWWLQIELLLDDADQAGGEA